MERIPSSIGNTHPLLLDLLISAAMLTSFNATVLYTAKAIAQFDADCFFTFDGSCIIKIG